MTGSINEAAVKKVKCVTLLLVLKEFQAVDLIGCTNNVRLHSLRMRPDIYAGVASIVPGFDNCVRQSNVIGCSPPTVLSDGNTGPVSPIFNRPADGRQFVAWTDNDNSYLILVPPVTLTYVSAINIHLYINPSQHVGVPNILVYGASNPDQMTPRSGTDTLIPFDILNNDHLSDLDATVKNITLRLRFIASYRAYVIVWDYNNLQNTSWFIMSEISVCSDSLITYPSILNISFLTQSQLSNNGILTMTCTVANEGSFMWRWRKGPTEITNSDSGITILSAHATRTSVLRISTVFDSYSCDVSYTAKINYFSLNFFPSRINVVPLDILRFQPDIYLGVASVVPGFDNCVRLLSNSIKCSPPTILSDNNTGPVNPMLFKISDGRQFVAWADNDNRYLSLVPTSTATMISAINMHLYINPSQHVGVPNILIYGASSTDRTMPRTNDSLIPFDIMNNDQLSDLDATVRNLTLQLRSAASYRAYIIVWDYNNLQSTSWFIMSEISLYLDLQNVTYPTNLNISFLDPILDYTIITPQSKLFSNGLLTLTCTVANEGSFTWRWRKGPKEITINDSGTTILTAHATRTSIITIPATPGIYFCDVSYTIRISHFSKIFIMSGINTDERPLVIGQLNDTVSLSCQFLGYLSSEINFIWKRWNTSTPLSNNSTKYNISSENKDMYNISIYRNYTTTLLVRSLDSSDEDMYSCAINVNGTEYSRIINVQTMLPPPLTTNSNITQVLENFTGDADVYLLNRCLMISLLILVGAVI